MPTEPDKLRQHLHESCLCLMATLAFFTLAHLVVQVVTGSSGSGGSPCSSISSKQEDPDLQDRLFLEFSLLIG